LKSKENFEIIDKLAEVNIINIARVSVMLLLVLLELL
jgi:hypothetical protein